jgi:DNA polymerase-3 subunit alpha
VGRSAIESILAARDETGDFRSLYHFTEQLDLRLVNKRVVESLVQAGAFDAIEPNRAALCAAAESAIERAARMQNDRSRGQTLLFDPGAGGEALEPPLPPVSPWARREALEREKSVVGFYVTGHPLADFADEMSLANATAATLGRMRDGEKVALAGIVTGQRKIQDSKGRTMAFVQVEDLSGTGEVILFASAYPRYASLLDSQQPLLFRGVITVRNEDAPKVSVSEVFPLGECRARFTRLLQIRAPIEALGEDALGAIREILLAHPGSVPVRIVVDTDSGLVEVRSRRYRVDPGGGLLARLKEAVGERNVSLVGDAAA